MLRKCLRAFPISNGMKKLIIANWKMSPTSAHNAKDIFRRVRKTSRELQNVETVICPPFVFLSDLGKMVESAKCVIGAQDIFWEDQGSYTGEISAPQLDRLGARYVILGHSERRALGETDVIVNKKVKTCLHSGFRAVLCIGEEERDPNGAYLRFIKEQLTASLAKIVIKNPKSLVIAYEPVWAISSHHKGADTPESALEMSIYIRKVLSGILGKRIALEVLVLYGGSVDDTNAEGFLKAGGVQGFLVGRASLDPRIFSEILRTAEKVR